MIKTYKFKLFYNKRKSNILRNDLFVFSTIYNHSIALIKRHYKLFGKNPTKYTLQKHLKKLMDNGSKPKWKELGYSQGIQEVTDRIYKSYSAFYSWCKKGKIKSNKRLPPKFRPFRKYKSFTLKQAGWNIDQDNSTIRIGSKNYKYNKSRTIRGTPKILTVKRDAVGDWYIFIVCDLGENFIPEKVKTMTGKNAGFDFGLKTFLTSSDNDRYHSNEFLKTYLKEIKKKSKILSRKQKGSKNRYKARIELAKVYRKVSRKRMDTFFKLADNLLSKYDNLIFENLNIEAMKKLWGRKVSDYSFHTFLTLLEQKSMEYGKSVLKVDRFFPSSKLCSKCKNKKDDLLLSDRVYNCSICGLKIDRDLNAAINILLEGTSSNSLDYVSPNLIRQ